MGKYFVIEMQNGSIGGNNWTYDERADAEVKMYQVLSEVVKSPVTTHAVMMVTDEGFPLERKCYKHGEEPESTVEDSAPLEQDGGTGVQEQSESGSDALSGGEEE